MYLRYKNVMTLLNDADKIVDSDTRAGLLAFNMRSSLTTYLAAIHNPDIKFERPANLKWKLGGIIGLTDTNLDNEARRIYIFQKSHNLTPERKTTKMIQLLESVSRDESTYLYEFVFNKKGMHKNLNKNFVKKYFPEILTYSIDRVH